MTMSRWDILDKLYDNELVGHYWSSYMTVSRWDMLVELYDSEQVGLIGQAI